MKKRLVGVSDIVNYNDKKTGQPKVAMSLYVMGPENRVFGFSTSSIFLGDGSPFFDMFYQLVQMRAINQVIGKDIRISFTQRGFLDELEFVDDIPILKQVQSSYNSSIMADFPFEEPSVNSSVQNSSVSDDKNKTSTIKKE